MNPLLNALRSVFCLWLFVLKDIEDICGIKPFKKVKRAQSVMMKKRVYRQAYDAFHIVWQGLV
ncbi:hypothetical protein JCM14469_05280 [Desulfatiferula olefinivorans]